MLDNDTSQAEALALPGQRFGGLRLLGGNNNNQGNYYYSFPEEETWSYLFFGTAAFCLLVMLFMVFRIKNYRRKERHLTRLGFDPKGPRKKKHSTTDTPKGDRDSNLLTDEELKKFILPMKEEESLHEAAKVVRCDKETGRILDICKPYWLSSFVSAVASVVNTALVGKVLGLDALAIYYIVTVPPALTGTIIWAVLETVSSLGGQAIGAGSYKLTGQYCQISIILVR